MDAAGVLLSPTNARNPRFRDLTLPDCQGPRDLTLPGESAPGGAGGGEAGRIGGFGVLVRRCAAACGTQMCPKSKRPNVP